MKVTIESSEKVTIELTREEAMIMLPVYGSYCQRVAEEQAKNSRITGDWLARADEAAKLFNEVNNSGL